MAFQGSQYGDIYANLAVSQEETRSGSSRVVNLSGGRSVNVTVPAGISDGEEIRLRGQGDPAGPGGMAGDLVLRITVVVADPYNRPDQFQAQQTSAVPTEPMVSQQAMQSRPDYRASGADAPPMNLPGVYYSPSAPTEANNPYSPGQASSSPQNFAGPGSYPQYQGYNQQAEQFYPTQYAPPPQPQPLPQSLPPQQPTPQPRKRSGALVATIIVLVIVLLGASGLVFYLGYYQPQQAHITGTATAQSQDTQTANINATSTTQARQGTAGVITSQTAQAQATSASYQNIYTQATSQAPAFNDSMSNQTGRQWDQITSSPNGTCRFTGGSYHSKMPSTGFIQPCFANNTHFSNFAFQATMTLVEGDTGGLIFRANSTANKFYLFRINTNGTYDLFLYVGPQASQAQTLLTGGSELIKSGQANTITVVAQGSNLYFYVNQHYVNSTSDGTYTSGQIGVFADASSQATEAAFSNVEVWAL